MTFPHDPLSDPLNDWLDARATGKVPPAAPDSDADLTDLTDLLATARQLDHLARRDEEVARTTRRRRSWEDQMTASSARLHPNPSGNVRSNSNWQSSVNRWQPIVSFSVVLLLLLGLLAITIDRASSPGAIPPTSTNPSLSAALQAEGQATPAAAGACVGRDVSWEGEPDPAGRPAIQRYQPIMSAPAEIGAEALSTYIGFMSCLTEASTRLTSEEHALLDTYLTANAQQWDVNQMHGSWPVSERTGNGWTIDRQITSEMVIPVNRPLINFHVSEDFLANGSASIPIFWPGDVYELVDGRYGVVIGSVSTEEFREGHTGNDPSRSVLLTFVGFEEQNGQLFIDEIRDFCTGEWVYLDENGRQISTPPAQGEIACR